MMAIPLSSNYSHASYTFSHSFHALPLFFARRNFTGIQVSRPCSFRLFCQAEFKTERTQIRRCSPFLESSLLAGSGVVVSDEWKAVPDIWRSSAEKYGDKVALVDPYHDPPSTMTYKQLKDAILDFAEGLRVIGVKPDEKLALFADNSCRWLVADQGVHNFVKTEIPSCTTWMHKTSPILFNYYSEHYVAEGGTIEYRTVLIVIS